MAGKQVVDPTVIPITITNSDPIQAFVRDRLRNFPRAEIRSRLETLDKYYHMQTRRKPGDPDFESRYRDVDVGMVSSAAETDTGFYVDTFLTSTPMFAAVSKKDQIEVAAAVESKIGKDEATFAQRAEMIKLFRNLAKHNKGLVEVSWEDTISSKEYSGNITEQGEQEVRDVNYSGNKFKNWSLYNSFWDTSVDMTDLSDEGEFVGNVAMISYVKLAELESTLGIDIPTEVWESAQDSNWNENSYVSPDIWADQQKTPKDAIDWMSFAGYTQVSADLPLADKYRNAKRLYTLHTIYARLIPALHGIVVPAPRKPQIFKLMFVNGKLVYIKHEQNFHNRISVLGCQVMEDDTGVDTQGPAQMAAQYQDTTKMLLDRQFAILDRLIGDRALFDPSLIDSESVNSKVPDAKIPTRPSAKTGIAGAYQAIPFNPNGFFEFGALMEAMKRTSDESIGVNKAQQGQFVQGNKTLGEWDDVMHGAQTKPFMRALVIESTVLTKMKFIVKSNILQYQTKEDFVKDGSAEPVSYDPADVRKYLIDIRLADGLQSAAKLLRTGGLELMLNLIMQNPNFGAEYDVAGVFAHLLGQGKGIDISDYKLTEDQKNARMQAQAAQQPQG